MFFENRLFKKSKHCINKHRLEKTTSKKQHVFFPKTFPILLVNKDRFSLIGPSRGSASPEARTEPAGASQSGASP